MGERLRKARAASSEPAVPEVSELPERWSAQRKAELVLRLRGEALDAVSRQSQVAAQELESWKRVFLEHGRRGLKIRGEPHKRADAGGGQDGELMMKLELAEDLIEKRALRTSGRGAEDEAADQSQHGPPLYVDDELRGVPASALQRVFLNTTPPDGGRRAGAGQTRTEDHDERCRDRRRYPGRARATSFHGEGYRKVRARLAHQGFAVSGKRVLRLMRAQGFLARRRLGPPNGNPAHDGTIITEHPDVMWGTAVYSQSGGDRHDCPSASDLHRTAVMRSRPGGGRVAAGRAAASSQGDVPSL